MTENQTRLATTLITAVAMGIYIWYLIHMSCPDCQSRLTRARQWLKWRAWRAEWDAKPTWLQEALIVRGKGPQ